MSTLSWRCRSKSHWITYGVRRLVLLERIEVGPWQTPLHPEQVNADRSKAQGSFNRELGLSSSEMKTERPPRLRARSKRTSATSWEKKTPAPVRKVQRSLGR